MDSKVKAKIKQIVKCQVRYFHLLQQLMEIADIDGVIDNEKNWDLSLYASDGMLLDERTLTEMVEKFQAIKKKNEAV